MAIYANKLHPCPDCNGTGRDEIKTAAHAKEDAEFRHQVKHHGSYIRCWNCHGNGSDPAAFFRWSEQQREEKR